MKRMILAVLVLGALLLAGPVAAAPIYSGAQVKITAGIGGADHGGAFLVTSVDGSFTSFLTFCIQRDEYFTPGATYWAYLSGAAVAGGDPVDSQTAWIYSQWLGGATFGIADAVARANGVQNAIWHIEGELAKTPTLGLTVNGKAIYDLAKLAYPDGSPQELNGVFALNLYQSKDKTGDKQDMLAAPVPEPASMLLFGTGLVGLAAAARRRFRK